MMNSVLKMMNPEQTAEELFTKLDTDGTGDLDAKEMHAVLGEIGIKVSLNAASATVGELDLDGDGTLEIGELMVHFFLMWK